jgi:hypothetical protein
MKKKQIQEAVGISNQSAKSKMTLNETALFTMLEIQRMTIAAIQKNIDRIMGQHDDLISVQRNTLDQQGRLIAIAEDLIARIEALEGKKERVPKLRIIKGAQEEKEEEKSIKH